MNCYQLWEFPLAGKSCKSETRLFQIQHRDLPVDTGCAEEFLAPYLFPDRLRKISDKTAIN